MASCLSSTDCDSLQICLENFCTHKPLFPITSFDILTIIFVFLSSIITTVAGVGGGIFFFPILMGINFFAPTQAVAISLSVVMLLMIVRYAGSYTDRHPSKDKPLINYDVSVIFSPSNVVGTILGVFLNRTLPNWILLLLILISLGFAFKKTWQKAKAQKEKEIKERMESPLFVPLQTIDKESKKASNKLLDEILKEERNLIPVKKFKILVTNILVLIACLLIQGTKTLPSIIGIPYCSIGFWFALFLYIPLGAFILNYSSKLLNEEYNKKVEAGYEFLASDIKWDSDNVRKSVSMGIIIGFTSAILGVGGALVTSPILIEMGFDAREATFTATFIAVFTSIAGAMQYIFAGMVHLDYMLACFIVGLGGLYIGMHYILGYVKRTNQTSIIMQALTFCIALTMILVAIPGYKRSLSDYESGSLLKFRDYC